MVLAVLSDTHSRHSYLTLPPSASGVLHCGDFCCLGAFPTSFTSWVHSLPVPLACVLGNHEHQGLGRPEAIARALSAPRPAGPGAVVLRESAAAFLGLRLWGVSWGDAAEPPAGEQFDIVLGHQPPLGVLDEGAGCARVSAMLARVRPALYLCGHAHGCGGQWARTGEGVLVVNVAQLMGRYMHRRVGIRPPTILRVEPPASGGAPVATIGE